MMNQDNGNYGFGWHMTSAQFNINTSQLQTLSGEVNIINSFPSSGNILLFRDRKFLDMFVRHTTDDALQIMHKDGVMEILRRLVTTGPYVIRELVFENGEIFDFVYDSVDRLASITNRSSGRTVLTLTYQSNLLVSAEIFQGSGRTKRINFNYANGDFDMFGTIDGIDNSVRDYPSYARPHEAATGHIYGLMRLVFSLNGSEAPQSRITKTPLMLQ